VCDGKLVRAWSSALVNAALSPLASARMSPMLAGAAALGALVYGYFGHVLVSACVSVDCL